MNDRKMTEGDIMGTVAQKLRNFLEVTPQTVDMLDPPRMPEPGENITLPDGQRYRAVDVDGWTLTLAPILEQISCTVGFKEPMP